MDRATAVTDTSPIVALVGVGALHLLPALFDRVLVPFDVWRELVDKPGATEPGALLTSPGFQFYPTPSVPGAATGLDLGERAAIALASSLPGAHVLLDDFQARKIARSLGLRVVGTLGVLAEAKRNELIPAARPLVEKLMAGGFYISAELFAQFCLAVGECL